MTVTEMRVHMDCAGCESKIKKALRKLQGVDVIDIDMTAQKVTVMGWADQEKVLKAVRKTGRRAELWPYPYDDMQRYYYYYQQQQHEVEPPITHYVTQYSTTTTTSSYNSHKNSYSDVDYGYYQSPPYSIHDDARASSMFSDENPHACSIM